MDGKYVIPQGDEGIITAEIVWPDANHAESIYWMSSFLQPSADSLDGRDAK